MKPQLLSYWEKPELKIPTTLNCWYVGRRRRGVSSPWGLVAIIVEPTVAPMVSARSFPRTIGGTSFDGAHFLFFSGQGAGGAGFKGAAAPIFTDFSSSLTRFSYSALTHI